MTRPLFSILVTTGLILSVVFQHGGLSLLLGMAVATTTRGQTIPHGSAVSTYALQAGVVLLGLGLSLSELGSIGQSSVWLISISVLMTLLTGYLLGRWLGAESEACKLLSGGTAICGGTAVVTLAPAIGASARQIGHVLPIIYVLNGVAMLLFPTIGEFFALSEHQFGLWCAVAIHDTAAVVGSAATAGDHALAAATTAKLMRVLWLIPVSWLFAATAAQGGVKLRLPLFIVGFLAASVAGSIWPLNETLGDLVSTASRSLFCVAIYLIGTRMALGSLLQIPRALILQAGLLWLSLGATSLLAVSTLWQ